MPEDELHTKLTYAKTASKKNFISDYLGHEPSREEIRMFSFMHGLNDTKIYFKGSLIGHLRFFLKNDTIFTEYVKID